MTHIDAAPLDNCRLVCAPAGAGKTHFAVTLCRAAAAELGAQSRVVVPTHLQARAWRQRLAEAGGAVGVRVLTFDGLYAEILDAAGTVYMELTEAVQYRLIRAVLDGLPLAYYTPLVRRPGFIQVVQGLLREFRAAHIRPADLTTGVDRLSREGAGGRQDRWQAVGDLALIYAAYQQQLESHGWIDRAGLGWLATEALARRREVGTDWQLLAVDGFDDFSAIQLDVLRSLVTRPRDVLITLTGCVDDERRLQVHRRFLRTRRKLAQALGLAPTPLPQDGSQYLPGAWQAGIRSVPAASPPALRHPDLAHLEANLLRADAAKMPATGAVEMLEAPDRAAEVAAALRWLKARLVVDGMRPASVALLARDIGPYRPFILETAAEFGMHVRLVDGLSLPGNPAVAALLDLLRLMLPTGQAPGEPALPYRLVIEAWLSPYFDWNAQVAFDDPTPVGIQAGDAASLDAAAHWGRVTGGLGQWAEVLDYLANYRSPEPAVAPGDASLDPTAGRGPAPADDLERGLPPEVPSGAAAEVLQGKFERFVRRLAPPGGLHPYRAYVAWLETLVGSDPSLDSPRFPIAEEPTSLRMVACTRRAEVTGEEAPQDPGRTQTVTERDMAALHAFKEVLRGLVWAEQALGTQPVDYATFFAELAGAVEVATYQLPISPAQDEILVADVVQARGLALQAAALLGLAEGEFPAVLAEDHFLRDADRAALRERCGLALDPSLAGSEAEYFYEAITRPRERLLLTRSRLADNGSAWQSSPFWEEVLGLLDVTPIRLEGDHGLAPEEAASQAELLECLALLPPHAPLRSALRGPSPALVVAAPAAGASAASCGDHAAAGRDVLTEIGERWGVVEAGARLVQLRNQRRSAGSPYDGGLQALAGSFAERFGPDQSWSASRLEQYRTCPFYFFTASVLRLQAREAPDEGLDARQRGNIYHAILARLYDAAPDPGDLNALLAALPAVTCDVLDAAPQHEGFRATAWWDHSRAEMAGNVRATVIALDQTAGGYVPIAHELGFFGRRALVVRDGEDSFHVHGVIDRIDRAPDGSLRIIDYKTGSLSAFSRRAVVEGSKLQLVLYAAAAQDALGLGPVADGFYWSVERAEASPYRLAEADGGIPAALAGGFARAWETIHAVRSGAFEPAPPAAGCPPFCPAAAFCWHYKPGFGGD